MSTSATRRRQPPAHARPQIPLAPPRRSRWRSSLEFSARRLRHRARFFLPASRARSVTTAMNRYIDTIAQSPANAPVTDHHADQQACSNRAPEAADATQHDDQKGRHDGVDADLRPDAPYRRQYDPGECCQRDAECEYTEPQSGQVDAERIISLSYEPALIFAPYEVRSMNSHSAPMASAAAPAA